MSCVHRIVFHRSDESDSPVLLAQGYGFAGPPGIVPSVTAPVAAFPSWNLFCICSAIFFCSSGPGVDDDLPDEPPQPAMNKDNDASTAKNTRSRFIANSS